MVPRSAETDASWQAFRRHPGLDHYNYVVESFGDSPEMATELADLAVAGIKESHSQLRPLGKSGGSAAKLGTRLR